MYHFLYIKQCISNFYKKIDFVVDEVLVFKDTKCTAVGGIINYIQSPDSFSSNILVVHMAFFTFTCTVKLY